MARKRYSPREIIGELRSAEFRRRRSLRLTFSVGRHERFRQDGL